MEPLEIDVIEKGVGRLLSQFQGKVNIEALLTSFLTSVQSAEDLVFQTMRESELPLAVGVQLDLLGLIFTVPRDGRSDEDYRNAIISNISIDTTKATIDSGNELAAAINCPPVTNFPSANLPYDGTNVLWSKPNANVIVEITAVDNDFLTIPQVTRLGVQDTVGAGIKASTVMMKKDFYMDSLVEGTNSIQQNLIEVDGGTVPTQGELAYTTQTDSPIASGNVVKKSVTGSEFISSLEAVEINNNLYAVIDAVSDITIDSVDYIYASFSNRIDTLPTVSFVTFYSSNINAGWSNSSSIVEPLLITDSAGLESLFLDYSGTGITTENETERFIGILMEVRHD